MKTGLVIQSTGKWYIVISNGDEIECRLPGRFRLQEQAVTNPVAVGDKVDISMTEDGFGVIEDVQERNNYIPRQATHSKRGEQILVANVDCAWAVVSVRKPKLKTGFIDRFLVTCEAYQVTPSVIINKTDLATPKDLGFLEEITGLYRELGYRLLLTSLNDSESLEELTRHLNDKISVFIGPSGAGKTSLLNAIDSNLDLKVGKISDYSNKGRHTTTYARLVKLNTGGFVADTPGIRELGLVNIEPYELSLFYPEMRSPRQKCKFYNCTHSHEPDCAVVDAFDQGAIHPERYNSYLNILDSLAEE